MTTVLHDPGFRKLESVWRSVVLLLSRIEVTTKLRIYLIDVSKEELAADLLSTDEPTEWGFAHTLLRPISEHGEELRWAALLSAFDFGQDPEDIPLLQRLGFLAESGGVPFFGGGAPPLLGARSLPAQPDPRDWTEALDPLWSDLRQRAEANWINLSLPAFLLRNAYGPDGGKTRRFGFAEDASSPEDLLWGNPSFLWGVVLAQEFARSGWGLRILGRHSVPQIPMYLTADGWASAVRANLSHSAASRVQELGLSQVINNRNEPEVHLYGLGSISNSEGSLRAWWRNPA
jgi:type VI secretion system protein ImpC